MLSPLFLRFPPLFALLPNQTRVDSFILDFPAAVSLQYHGTNLSTTAAGLRKKECRRRTGTEKPKSQNVSVNL